MFASSSSSHLNQRRELGLKHLFDGTDWNVYNSKIINLGVGAPGPDLLKQCCEIFKNATNHRMNIEYNTNAYLFQYGPTSGTPEVRSTISSYLSQAYNNEVHKEDLIITTGATHGLHLILSTLIDMNGFVFVDSVTYMIALDVFKQFSNLKIIPVELTKNGVNVDLLRNLLQKYKFNSENKLFWGIYYTIPTYHNPTGILFSADTCKSLIETARENNILIVCDDVYNVLHYNDDNSPKRLFAYDDLNDMNYQGNVISNGTFSKIVAPGIRLGWLECPPRCIDVFNSSGILNSGGCTNNYTSGIIASMLQIGLLQPHIEMMADNYKKRMITFCNVLKNELPSNCNFIEPGGGYFIWIELPEDVNGIEFNKFCMEKFKVYTIPGSRFSIDGKFSNYLRVSIAFHPENVLQEGAKRLCNALNEYINNSIRCDL